MSNAVKVGQVWRDKDKRRNVVIEIISTNDLVGQPYEAVGLVVGTEEERVYKVDRLVKRWELVEEKASQGVQTYLGKRVVGGRNYHLLVECPVDGEGGQRFRTTQKQYDTFGAPLCGCHHKAMNLIEQH